MNLDDELDNKEPVWKKEREREREREREKEKSVKLSLNELLPYQKWIMLKLTLRWDRNRYQEAPK